MLVLTRKSQERISIGQDITITVLKIKGNSVQIGIDAPHHVRVVRGELSRYDTPGQDASPELPRASLRGAEGALRVRQRTARTALSPLVRQISRRCDEGDALVISGRVTTAG